MSDLFSLIRRCRFIAVSVALFLEATCFGELPDPVDDSLVRIEAMRAGNDRPSVSAGFVFLDDDHVVTCLHSIYGATDIKVHYQGAKATRRARVEKCLESADLVLLVVEDAPEEVEALVLAEAAPRANSKVMVWGFPGGMKSPQDYECRVKHATGQSLKDVLNDKQQRDLSAAGLYDLNLRLLHLEATLTVGCSGGPVLAGDEVVGVVCGGLEKGATSISWAIPSSQLEALLEQDKGKPRLKGDDPFSKLETVFSADLRPSSTPTSIEAGAYTFVRVRTRTLAELQSTADNTAQLQSILNMVAQNPGVPPDFRDRRFDIYECAQNAAVLVVPAGLRLEDDGEDNLSCSDASGFELRVRCGNYPSQMGAVQASHVPIQFGDADPNLPHRAIQDPFWSDAMFWIRWDGVWAQRRSLDVSYMNGVMMRLFGLIYVRPPMNGSVELLQAAVLNRDTSFQALTPARKLRWAEWMLAVQLSGFVQGLSPNQGWTQGD